MLLESWNWALLPGSFALNARYQMVVVRLFAASCPTKTQPAGAVPTVFPSLIERKASATSPA